MSPVFGKNKSRGATIAVLDVETGSVGGALVRIEKKEVPKLMAQYRRGIPLLSTMSAHKLFSDVGDAAEDALLEIGTVAARLRNTDQLSELGNVERIAIFLHSPWVGLDMSQSPKIGTEVSDGVIDALKKLTEPSFDGIPVTFHAFSLTTTPVLHGLFKNPENALICNISGEVAELSLMRNSILAGHATMPFGFNGFLRTLQTHAGMSRHEAASAIALAARSESLDHEWAEALSAGVQLFTSHFRDAAQVLLPQGSESSSQRVFVVAPDMSGDLFARMLSDTQTLNEVFPFGSTIRAVRGRNLAAELAQHPENPDVPLLLEALFVDSRFA